MFENNIIYTLHSIEITLYSIEIKRIIKNSQYRILSY